LNSITSSAALAKSEATAVRTILILDGAREDLIDAKLKIAIKEFDEIRTIAAGSASKSWRKMLRIARGMSLTDTDILYFVEDDHLHTRQAISKLQTTEADLRFLYASHQDLNAVSNYSSIPTWVHIPSGVSSFAMSGQSFRKHYAVLRFFSFGGGSWDELICRALGKGQVLQYGAGVNYVLWPVSKESPWSQRIPLRALRHSFFRLLAMLHGFFNSAKIQAIVPPESTHCEIGLLADSRDWAQIAKDNQL
jgi:hypothetical protein